MVTSRQLEILLYRGSGRHRGRGFGAIAQDIERGALPFSRKYFVPAAIAKRLGADLLEFAVPESADIVTGRKNFNPAAKNMGTHTLRKQLGTGGRKRTASRIIPTKSAKQTSRS